MPMRLFVEQQSQDMCVHDPGRAVAVRAVGLI